MRPLLVVGLDCVPPALAFDRLRSEMPNLSRLIERGAHGPLRSTTPPITVPAWTTMFTGRDPGELGLYGFRNRVPESYAMRIATQDDVVHPRIWELAEQAGIASTVLFVPPGYPLRDGLGEACSCFLTPGPDRPWARPASLMRELEAFGAPIFDVEEVRGGDPLRVIRDAAAMTRQHFAIARHLVETRARRLTAMVEIGPDRVHHAAYSQLDPAHPRYDAGSEVARAALDYYRLVDRELGALVGCAPDANVVVLSDHGARPLEGGVYVNEWLRQRGLLVLREPVSAGPLTPEKIDWSRTSAWGEGGYYARVFLNVKGREPEGIVKPSHVEALRRRIADELIAMRKPDGSSLGTTVGFPESTYQKVDRLAPDLSVYFGDLTHRSLGSVGAKGIFSDTNDTGHDECNHDWNGIFVMSGPDVAARGSLGGLDALDVMPTLCRLLGVDAPSDLRGRDRSRG